MSCSIDPKTSKKDLQEISGIVDKGCRWEAMETNDLSTCDIQVGTSKKAN